MLKHRKPCISFAIHNVKWTPGEPIMVAKCLTGKDTIELTTRLAAVRPAGFEPATLGSEDRCAVQLRHGR